MTLILPVGPPGSGKTQLANRLLEMGVLDMDAIVSPDVMRRIITGKRESQHDNATVFAVCDEIARGRLRNGLSVYYDATNLTSLPAFNQMAHEVDADIVCIRFAYPEEVLRIRNETRSDPVPYGVLQRMIDAYNRIPLERYPGTTLTPDEAIKWAEKGWLL